MNIALEPDYGSLSSRAIRKIIKELQKFPENATHAAIAAGYKQRGSETLDEKTSRELLEKLEPLKKGTLRNPVVEKVLNQLITLVNELIASDEFGRPDEIRIELARDLKSGAKERKRKEVAINKARKENEAIRDILTNEFGIKRPSRRDVFRYRCWVEQKHQCLYTGEPLPQDAIINGEEYDLDHIIPRSRMFNDSFANLVLVKRSANQEKDNQTAHDYMAGKGKEALDTFLVRVKSLYDEGSRRKAGQNLKPVSARRKHFPLMKGKDIPQDFIERQLRESQYIVKEAMHLLRQVSREVTTQPTQETTCVTTGTY